MNKVVKTGVALALTVGGAVGVERAVSGDFTPFNFKKSEPTLAEQSQEALSDLEEAQAEANSALARIAEGCVPFALKGVIDLVNIEDDGTPTPVSLDAKANYAAIRHDWCVEGRPEGDGWDVAIIGRGENLIAGGAEYDEAAYNAVAFEELIENQN